MDFWTDLATIVEALAVVGGLCFLARQLRLMRRDHDRQQIAQNSERTVGANWRIVAEPQYCAVVAELEDLMMPDGMDSADYWAARAVHLSHLNLLWQVWETGGRPKPNHRLKRGFDGWERFAKQVVVPALAGTKTLPLSAANALAGQHLWEGLKSYQIFSPGFGKWLEAMV